MIKDQKIKNFLDTLASKSATPGGGSVSSLMGAMSAALLSMVSNLTIGKDKYKDVEEEIRILLQKSERLRANFENLMEQDIEVFNQLMAVMKLPKETEDQKEFRRQKMQSALFEAANVPLEVAKKSKELLDICQEIADKGNKNAISDAGIGVILAEATLHSAILNIQINIKMIQDEKIRSYFDSETKELLGITKGLKDQVLKIIIERI